MPPAKLRHTCPCCGSRLAQPVAVSAGFHLSPVQERIFRLVRDYPNQMTQAILFERVYGNSPRAPTSTNALSANIVALNRNLARYGMRVRSNPPGGHGAVYYVGEL